MEIKKHVQNIVKDIESGMSYEEAGQEIDAEANGYDITDTIHGFDYLEGCLDIEYIVSSSKEYLGARVLVAFGGPNIWINTRTKQVEGYWWGDSCLLSYDDDPMGIDEALEELYNCQ